MTDIVNDAIRAHERREQQRAEQTRQREAAQAELRTKLVHDGRAQWNSKLALELYDKSDAQQTKELDWRVLEETQRDWDLVADSQGVISAKEVRGHQKAGKFRVGTDLYDGITLTLELRTPSLEERGNLSSQIDNGPLLPVASLADLGRNVREARG